MQKNPSQTTKPAQQQTQVNKRKESQIHPIFISENHLSSSYQKLLTYERRNYQLEQLTRLVPIVNQKIQKEITQLTLQPSKLKGQQIFEKYGSLIQNQPLFIRELVMNNYLPYLPKKFQNQFSQIVMLGSAFEALWWGSMAFLIFRAFKRRNIQIQLKQRALKGLGLSFAFLATSIGFHEQFYIPRLKNCLFKNIKYVDSMMARHIKLLKDQGYDIDKQQQTVVESVKAQNHVPQTDANNKKTVQVNKNSK